MVLEARGALNHTVDPVLGAGGSIDLCEDHAAVVQQAARHVFTVARVGQVSPPGQLAQSRHGDFCHVVGFLGSDDRGSGQWMLQGTGWSGILSVNTQGSMKSERSGDRRQNSASTAVQVSIIWVLNMEASRTDVTSGLTNCS